MITPIELNVFAQNILNSSAYYYPEFARDCVNILPMNTGMETQKKQDIQPC